MLYNMFFANDTANDCRIINQFRTKHLVLICVKCVLLCIAKMNKGKDLWRQTIDIQVCIYENACEGVNF